MSFPIVSTIQELESLYYGMGSRYFLTKADDPWLSTTTGAFNAIYGSFVWINANMEANIFGLLPKIPWDISGVRLIKSKVGDMSGTNISKYGGTPDTGVIAETKKPDLVVYETKPKLMQYPFEVGYIAEFLATKAKDDNWGNLSQQRLYAGVQFKEKLNQALGADEEVLATGAGAGRTALTHFEAIDVIIAAKSEKDAFIAGQADWYDPWVTGVIDRDAVTTYDCTVRSPSGTIGTDGQITDSLLREVPLLINEASGGFPTVALTGQKTMNEIEGQYNNQIQYNLLGETMVQLDVNGIQTFKGHGAGMHVTTVYNIPYVVSKDTPYKTGGTELPRIVFLDTSDYEGSGTPRLAMQVAEPVTYYEASRATQGFPWVRGKWAEAGLYMMMGEVLARHFSSHGKIRDIMA